jgi:hypothetical protein
LFGTANFDIKRLEFLAPPELEHEVCTPARPRNSRYRVQMKGLVGEFQIPNK